MKKDRASSPHRWVYYTGGLAIILCFSAYSTRFLIRQPLCCADNLYLAIAAKNFANGNGYVSSFPGNVYHRYDSRDPATQNLAFDPGVSTGGPSQWLSVAVQRVFPGNLFVFDMAGIATRALALVILLAFWPMRNVLGLTLYALLVWSLVVVGHFSQGTVFTSLGDMTAAIFLVLGVAVYRRGAEENLRGFLLFAVLIFWLAYLTKLTSALYAGIFLGGAGALLAARGEWKRLFGLAAFGFLLLALSEIVLLLGLGPEAYSVQRKATFILIEMVGRRSEASGGFAMPQIDDLYHPLALGVAFLLLLWLLARLRPRGQALLLGWSIVSALAYLVSNAGLGNANPRYFVLPVATLFMMGIHALASWLQVQFETVSFHRAFGSYLVSLALLIGLFLSGGTPLWMVHNTIQKPIPSTNRSADVHAYAAYLGSIEDTPIVSRSWQNAVDAEWLSSKAPGRIQGYWEIDRTQPFYILFDKRWNAKQPLSFFVREDCRETFSQGFYSVWLCSE